MSNPHLSEESNSSTEKSSRATTRDHESGADFSPSFLKIKIFPLERVNHSPPFGCLLKTPTIRLASSQTMDSV
jgi:hypothetical protein